MMTKFSNLCTILGSMIFVSIGSTFAANNVGPGGYDIAGAAKTPTIYTNTTRDYCPNGDFSPSVYDGRCTASSNTNTGNNTTGSQSININKPPLVSYDMDDERINELCESYRDEDYSFNLYSSLRLYRKDIFITCWMYDNRLSKFGRGSTFMGGNILRKDESSKFFYNLITHTMKTDPEITDNKCDYSDLDKAHLDLKFLIRRSCQIGLFDSTTFFNKSFRPESGVTRSTFEDMLLFTADTIGYEDADDIETLMTSDKTATRGITRTEAGHILYQFAVLADNSNIVPSNNSIISNTNNSNVNKAQGNVVDCGMYGEKAAENCMNTEFKTCSPAVLRFKMTNPSDLTFGGSYRQYLEGEWRIIGLDKGSCKTDFTYFISQNPAWDNKKMTCDFDPTKNFTDNLGGYYFNKCSGELRTLMTQTVNTDNKPINF